MNEESESRQLNNIDKFFKSNMITEAEAAKAVNFKSELKEALAEEFLSSEKKRMSQGFISNLRNNLFTGKFMLAGGAGVVGLLIISVFFFFSLIQTEDKQDDNNDDHTTVTAQLSYTEGDVEYTSDGEEWEIADDDMELNQGDSIRVLEQGRAAIELEDGSVIRLNNNSEVTLSTLEEESVIIANNEGEVYARVVDSDRKFDITIAEHKVTSLGTAFRTVNFDNLKGVDVFQSKVKAAPGDSSNSLVVPEGNRYYFVNSSAVDLQKVLIQIINDEIIDDDFIIWNKKQDETNPDFAKKLGILEDLQAPDLEVTEPKNNTKTDKENITIKGSTEKDASIKINEEDVDNNDGKFEHQIELEVGENQILIEATDAFGNKTSKLINVIREPKPTPTTPQVEPSIGLSATVVDSGIKFTWSVNGSVDTSKGFKIIKGTSSNLDWSNKVDSKYVSDSSARSAIWNLNSGDTFNFKVCSYTGSGCGVLSNLVTVTEPALATGVNSITLSNATATKVVWSVDGTASNGFKVVWSKTPDPTYPTGANTEYIYTFDQHTVLNAFDGAGTYYVRVCEYLGGSCGVYSNQITLAL